MPIKVTGGCKCGLVRYSGERAKADMFRCHCRDCQQLTGTGHSEMMPLKAATFSIGEEVKIFEMVARSGRSTFSGFCPECGSQLTRRSEVNNDSIYVHAGSLDNPEGYTPAKSIYISSAPTWDNATVESSA